MSTYLIEATYSAEGLKGLEHDSATGRKAAIKKLISGVGGKLIDMYYSFGDADVYVIAQVPDDVTTAALCLHISDTGLVRTKTTQLLTVEETDKAIEMKVSYQKPGTVKKGDAKKA